MAYGDSADLRLAITNRQIIKTALPISLAMLVPQLNFITNNVFLGQLGETELATAGLTGVYYLIFASIGYGLNNGLQALLSRRAGENKRIEIGRLFTQGLWIALTIAILGIVLTYTLAPYILSHAIASKELLDKSVHFLKIRIWGLPFLFVYQMRNALLVGINQSRLLVAGTLAETIANIFFDYGLIYGHFGLPELGFNGAAIASIIAEATGMFVVFLVIHFKGISREFQLFANQRPDPKNLKLILVQSSPLIFQHAISIISWQFFFILIEHHGKMDLAISNTMRNIFGFFGVFTWAFAATTNTMVSNVIGQGKKELVVTLMGKIVKISLLFGLIFALLLNIFPVAFLSIYGQDQVFIAEAIPVLRIVSLALVMMPFATVWLNGVTGTGNSIVSLLIEAIAIVVYCIYIYLVLEVYFLPVYIGWMSEWIYWMLLFVSSFFYIRSGRWKNKVI
ncbi:MAG TPA: MATE family efflux transporter [Flavitalea sp.]|nr:MATE family efflux transporter [Flavitalea sp.]